MVAPDYASSKAIDRVLTLESFLATSIASLAFQVVLPYVENWLDRPKPGAQDADAKPLALFRRNIHKSNAQIPTLKKMDCQGQRP